MGNISLTGKKVKHAAFGAGTVMKQSDSYITVKFPAGEKMFVFPDAFSHFLTADSNKLQQQLENAAADKAAAVKQAAEEKKAERERLAGQREDQAAGGAHTAASAKRTYRRSNAAFKCKYDDRGSEDIWQKVNEQLPALKQIRKNSMGALTTKPAKAAESQRYVFAVFLAEDQGGKAASDASVQISKKYRLSLSDEEAGRLLFWNYHASKNVSGEPTWSSGIHRYMTDAEAVQILRDIVTIKTGAADEHLALEFFNYFCQATQVDMSKVGNPSGALIK